MVLRPAALRTGPLIPVALSLCLVLALWLALGDAPAARDQHGVREFGSGAIVIGSGLYDPAEFLRQSAEQSLASAIGEGTPGRSAAARSALERALALAPADAFLWTALSWALLAEGDTEQSLRALDRSWALAPHNRALAPERLLLTRSIGTAAVAPDDPRAAVDREIVAQFARVDPDTLIPSGSQ